MNETGLVNILSLWICAALVSISVSALAVAKAQRQTGQVRLLETHAFLMAHGVARFLSKSGFSLSSLSFSFEKGHVRAQRVHHSSKEAKYAIQILMGKSNRTVDVEWEKMGERWKAVVWRER